MEPISVNGYKLLKVGASPDVAAHAWHVAKDGAPDSQYHVRIDQEGNWHCECIGFLHRAKCKHVSMCAAQLDQ